MTSFEKVKEIDSLTKDTVNGYLKYMYGLLRADNVYRIHETIPTLISYWCILYFYVKECFDPDRCCNLYKLSQDNSIAIQNGRGDMMAMLTETVSYGIHLGGLTKN